MSPGDFRQRLTSSLTQMLPRRAVTLLHQLARPSPAASRAVPPPSRLLSSSSKLTASYRRFGDAPRQPVRYEQRSRLPQGAQPLFGSSAPPFLRRFRRPPPIVYVVLAGGGAYYIFHLEKVERTGRWRFMDTSEAAEAQMAQQGFSEVMSEYGNKLLPDGHPTSRYVQSVVKRIVRANGLEAGPDGWETHVVQDGETRNAFVLPGGKIFVFTGILPIAQDADGLAVILGHEIAHQVARHSAERMSSLKVRLPLFPFPHIAHTTDLCCLSLSPTSIRSSSRFPSCSNPPESTPASVERCLTSS